MAGLYRKMMHEPDGPQFFFCFEVSKTKAHKDIAAITDEDELEEALGNDQADHGAKTRANALFAPDVDLTHFKQARLNWLGAARVVAATLAVFGPAKKQFGVLKKQPKQVKAKIEVQIEKRHRFGWNGANWQCRDCCTIKRSNVAWSDSQKCRGTSAVSAIEAGSNGHVLWAATVLASGSTIIWCRLCGRHAETRVKSLAQVCHRHMSAQAFGVQSRGCHTPFDDNLELSVVELFGLPHNF